LRKTIGLKRIYNSLLIFFFKSCGKKRKPNQIKKKETHENSEDGTKKNEPAFILKRYININRQWHAVTLMMAAASAPTLASVQLRVRALSESITERDAGSVEALETSLQQLNACAGEVSKLLELAKEKARKAAELAKKAELVKGIQDQIARLNAKLHQLVEEGPVDEVIVVPPAQEVAKASPTAAGVIAAPPPPKAAPRKQAGRGASPKPAGGASPKDAMPPPPKAAAPVKRAGAAVSTDPKRAKVPPPPVAAAAANVPPPAAGGCDPDLQLTQDVDWDNF
jgi:hypothetical protein